MKSDKSVTYRFLGVYFSLISFTGQGDGDLVDASELSQIVPGLRTEEFR